MNSTPLRTSPLHDALQHEHGNRRNHWGEVAGMPAVLHAGDPTLEASQAQKLALCDVSALPRILVKGPKAAEFLQSQGIPVPDAILKTAVLEGNGVVLRTGGGEFLLEDGCRGSVVGRIDSALGPGGNGVYRVVRQDASFLLSGAGAVDLFRQTCVYDFAPVRPGHDVVMTRVAGISCTILPRSLGGIDAFQFWIDGTFGLYLWEKLLEIAQESGGDMVGLGAFFPELRV